MIGCGAGRPGELERHVEVGGLDDPEADDVLLRLQEGPVAEQRLPTPVVDDGRELIISGITIEWLTPLGSKMEPRRIVTIKPGSTALPCVLGGS